MKIGVWGGGGGGGGAVQFSGLKHELDFTLKSSKVLKDPFVD